MAQFFITLLLAVCLAGSALAQPRIVGLHRYDEGMFARFNDIYLATDGGYIAGGLVHDDQDDWMLNKINAEFQSEWSEIYQGDGDNQIESIIQTDDGGYLAGGWSNETFTPMRTNGIGDVIWRNEFCGGGCRAVIELKNGNFLLIGCASTVTGFIGHVIQTNSAGDLVWERSFEGIPNAPYSQFYAGRETDGGVVLAGYTFNQLHNHIVPWVAKLSLDGMVIWNSTSQINGLIKTMVSSPDSGFVCGTDSHVMKINSIGHWEWSRNIIGADETVLYQLARFNEDGYAIVGTSTRMNRTFGIVYRLNDFGRISWTRRVDLETASVDLRGIIFDNDGSIATAGGINISGVCSALIVEIEPEIIGPTIVVNQPNTIDPVILIGDTLQFMIHAVNQWGDSISYAFFQNDEIIANDSTVTVQFDNLDDQIITGRAYSGGDSDQVVWHVEVTDFYIAAQTPEVLDLTVRRGNEVTFSIDSLRALDGRDSVNYQWSKLDLETQELIDLGQEFQEAIAFPVIGRYKINAVALSGESHDDVTWDIAVRGVVRSFFPSSREVNVRPFHSIDFSVVAFNPDSDSLHYTWFFNEEQIAGDSSAIEVQFGDTGIANMLVVLTDSTELDTVVWAIVIAPDGVNKPESGKVDKFELMAPYPNPFNSSTTLRFSLPNEGTSRLTVHDLNGRLIEEIINARLMPGEHTTIWDGIGLPAGIYYLRLESAGAVCVSKGVIIK